MKRISLPNTAILSGILLTLATTANVLGQLNENSVLRDATGVYRGKIAGGKMNYVHPDGSVSPGPGPTNSGKVKIPVKTGKTSVPLVDNELGGNDRARIKGASKKPKVLRGGKLIKMNTRGTIENPSTDETLENGRSVGTLQDRGPKWFAKATGSGQQPFDDGSKWVYSGRKLTGRG